MNHPEGFTAHCGFCDRDVTNFVQPPTMCEVTIKSSDGTLDATYHHMCMECAVAVIKTLGMRRGLN